MKTALIALAVAMVTVQAQAQQWPITKQETAPGQYSYWQGGRYLGSSHRNPGSRTETYWPNPAYDHGYGYGSNCCSPSVEGYRMGQNLGVIIRSLSGR